MDRAEMAEKMLKHLEEGGHISEGNEKGFSYWNVDRRPLRAELIFHHLKGIQDANGKLIKDLESKPNLRPFPPFPIRLEYTEEDLLMESGLPNYSILINLLLDTIGEDLLILDRWINNELIE